MYEYTIISIVVRSVADKRDQGSDGNVEQAETGVWVCAISATVHATGLFKFYDGQKPCEERRRQTKCSLPELGAAVRSTVERSDIDRTLRVYRPGGVQ